MCSKWHKQCSCHAPRAAGTVAELSILLSVSNPALVLSFWSVLGSPSASLRAANFKQDRLMNCWGFLKEKTKTKQQNQIKPLNS